jgi:hypothetical protein
VAWTSVILRAGDGCHTRAMARSQRSRRQDSVLSAEAPDDTFGFYLLRLTTERLLQNQARLEARLATRELTAGPPLRRSANGQDRLAALDRRIHFE